MEEKLLTVVVLPYSKAHIFKVILQEKGIECELQDVHIIQGAVPTTVNVKILEKDLQATIPELENFLGKKEQKEEKEVKITERQVLMPVDFSPSSLNAAKLAFEIALHLEAELVLMHNYINPIIHSMPFGDVYAFDTSALFKIEFAEKNANEQFSEFLKKLTAEIGQKKWEAVKSNVIIKSGYAEDDILAYAKKHNPLLIVLGSGGENYPHQIVGSVTADIMYNANVPVLVVPKDAPVKSIADFRKLLYATNFDEKDFVALEKLMKLIGPFDMDLSCVHVGQPKLNGWDLARLEGMREMLRDRYKEKNFNCMLLEGNDVLQALEDHIQHSEVDILSLTTHKRGMISRLFNPSLARRMLFHSHIPLLVFHA